MPRFTVKLQRVILCPATQPLTYIMYLPWLWQLEGVNGWSFSCAVTQVPAPEFPDSLSPRLNMRLSIQILRFVDHDCSRHFLSVSLSLSF